MNATSLPKDDQAWFIQFYVPWCQKCKELRRDWQMVSNTREIDIIYGSVNCVESINACMRFDVEDYPTFIYIAKDTAYVYQGNATAASLSQFTQKKKYLKSQKSFQFGRERNVLETTNQYGIRLKEQFISLVEWVFDQLDMHYIPQEYKMIGVAIIVVSPCVLMIIISICHAAKIFKAGGQTNKKNIHSDKAENNQAADGKQNQNNLNNKQKTE
ncbi:pdi-like protein [Stylonychia lemnae]|uniref:Pdi-like protein n=1 Tax=Stylonychia lemnae TaxID=5949 RepID=A0A078AGJ1_STYLE|nr:pdi-like protein [Stylonychia lemnae]|eukprot:CDW81349.1 pdi-like protein [Stylonychia lemnae]